MVGKENATYKIGGKKVTESEYRSLYNKVYDNPSIIKKEVGNRYVYKKVDLEKIIDNYS